MRKSDQIFFLLYGFIVWALATASFKVIGFDTDLTALNFIFLIVMMPVLNLTGYRVRAVKGLAKFKASMLFAVSGMLLDAVLLLNYPIFFSADNFPLMPTQGHFLGAWVLFGNALTLLTAYISQLTEKT
ncbi:MAG: DUF5367 family protein [Thermonemataceae bacterium]